MKSEIKNKFIKKLTVIGFASVDRFNNAPKNHHPTDILKNAKSVIIIGKKLPNGIFNSALYNQHFIHRSQHSIYNQLDEISLNIIEFIENNNFNAVPIPAFAPLNINKNYFGGLISLKHAAVNAGIGVFGKNEQVYHEKYGSLLRFAGIITDLELEADPVINKKTYCPENCNICIDSCSPNAIKGNYFKKARCLKKSIYHGTQPIIFMSLPKIEKFINTTSYNYWMNCSDCILNCPLNKKITVCNLE